jgi:hypothetical protein
MVSREKAKYYKGRLATIRQQLAGQIDKQFPVKETSYKALIAAGAGRLRQEEDIRRACGNLSTYACPPMLSLFDVFDISGERKAAEQADAEISAKRHLANLELRQLITRAEDLLQLGTEEQLLAQLESLEARVEPVPAQVA